MDLPTRPLETCVVLVYGALAQPTVRMYVSKVFSLPVSLAIEI